MQEWFSAAQLAGKPGMPATVSGVIRLAKRKFYTSRSRQGQGGGLEYHLSSLPAITQDAISRDRTITTQYIVSNSSSVSLPKSPTIVTSEAQHQNVVNELLPQTAQEETNQYPVPSPQPRQKGNKEDRIDAKLGILKILEDYCKQQQLQKINCWHVFAAAYNNGQLAIDQSIRQLFPCISASSLQRWLKTLETGSVTALGGKYGNRAGESKINASAALADFIVGMLTEYPHATCRQVMQALQGRFEKELLPSQRTLDRWIGKWREQNKELITAIANPDGWKSKYMAAFGSYSDGVGALNQLWEMDSTPADIMIGGKRHTLIGCIDVYSRMAMLLIVPRSNAVAIATLLRRCLMEWGVPEMIKTDNGKDYTANYLQRLFASLDIKQKLCQPFQPWQKPHIERFFRTFSHDLVELLPGYIGHNVAERQEIRARQSFSERLMAKDETLTVNMSAEEFQAFCDRWTNTVYAHRLHEGLEGQTPFQVVSGWQGSVKKIANERALDVLLAPAPGSDGLRVVQKRGIQCEGTYFIAPELEAWMGKSVQVRFDPLDLGKIYVFDGDFQLICIAEDPERTGIDRQEVAMKAKQMQKERLQAGKRVLKQISKKAKVSEVVEAILEEREEAIANVIAFPQRSEVHESQGLQSAADVLEALQPKQPERMTEEELREADRAFQRIQQVSVSAEIKDDDYFCRLWQAIKDGRHISPEDARWMCHYVTTPEGKGVLRFLEVSEGDVLSSLA